MNLKDKFTPNVREKLYIYSGILITMLMALGYISKNEAPLWISAFTSLFSLLFAIVHTTDKRRINFYSFVACVASLAQIYGVLDEQTSISVMGCLAAVLGVSTAAIKTPVDRKKRGE